MSCYYHGGEPKVTPSDWPRKIPPGAEHLCTAEWAFSPASSRIDVYKGWASRKRGRIFIWCKDMALDLAPVRFRPYVSGPLGLDMYMSLADCLAFGWRHEALNFELNPPNTLYPGKLSAGDLSTIEARTWSGHDDADGESESDLDSMNVAVTAWVGKAEWKRNLSTNPSDVGDRFSGYRWGVAIVQYVKRYLLSHGGVPLGEHIIDEEVGRAAANGVTRDKLSAAANRPGRVRLRVKFPDKEPEAD